MAKFEISQAELVPFVRFKSEPGIESDIDVGSARMRHDGSADAPQLVEVITAPNEETEIHAHQADEIIYILSGDLHVGGKTLRAGDTFYVAGMTLYSFKVGPDGCHFLNFRSRYDRTYYTRDQLAEYNTLDAPEQEAMTKRLVEERKALLGWA